MKHAKIKVKNIKYSYLKYQTNANTTSDINNIKYFNFITRDIKNIILIYEGEFTQEITKSVLSMAERNLESVREDESTKKKVFNVMVECLQNICKHADEFYLQEHKLDGAIFMIGSDRNNYFIMSGNYIMNENVESLGDKLNQINNLDKDGLKQLYKEIIINGNLSEKGGAGLGFVDIARKSGNKLDFNFVKVDAKFSFFCLKTNISRSKSE